MNVRSRTIEVDAETARALEALAEERGTTVPLLLAAFVASEREAVPADAAGLAELDRRWAAVEAGGATVPHEDVVRWLRTWGTPAFRRRQGP